ncbi:membrane protein yjeI [Klebsiella pneumoniae]|uniref:DUF4156 domain-containing protein n=1 Tax=Klebsiella pneumoniae TaxID=573 RepID=UPI000E2D5FCF|nr:DUF4156 domain-containing protein [Klebsiella pneumoniae]SXT04216.1 membrane protein yjeI [Klebsiella pneumoniae]
MQVKYLAGIVGAALLLAGCSSSNELTSAGQNVRFVQEKPGAECQLLGTATGKQSNWLSGQNGDEGGSMHGVSSPTQNLLSSFVPTDSEMNGQVYKCPN